MAVGADAGTQDDDQSDAVAADSDGMAEAEDNIVAEENALDTCSGPCPCGMVLIDAGSARFCVDKYEASLVETAADGSEQPYPHWLPVDGHTVRAVSVPDVFPQAFISEVQAEDACAASGKRLCGEDEWKTACAGPSKTTFPYGDTRQTGVCNDNGKSAVAAVFGAKALGDPVAVAPSKPAAGKGPPAKGGKTATKHGAKPSRTATRPASAGVVGRAAQTTRERKPRTSNPTAPATPPKKTATGKKAPHGATIKRAGQPAKASSRPASVEASVWTKLNDPRLGQVEGALSKTGSHEACVNGWGAVDMVGNLHEWVKTDASLAHGTFAGGYYLDTSLNGDGCRYRTKAHAHDYHDYSTGFRCCADAK